MRYVNKFKHFLLPKLYLLILLTHPYYLTHHSTFLITEIRTNKNNLVIMIGFNLFANLYRKIETKESFLVLFVGRRKQLVQM